MPTDSSLPPIEPPADLRTGALIHRQMFIAYTDAGFTEAQAMDFIKTMIVASWRPGTGTA